MTTSAQTKATPAQIVRFYWRHIKAYPFTLAGLLVLIPITILANQVIPILLVANVLGKLSKGQYIAGQPWQSFSSQILLYAGLTFAGGLIFWRLVDLLAWRLEGNILKNIAQEVFDHLTEQSADFHATHFSGSLVSQSNKLIGAYGRMADTTWYSTIPLIVSVGFSALILAQKAPWYAVLLIVFSVIFVLTAIFASKPVRRAGGTLASAESKQTGYLADVLGNVMAVKSFAREAHEKRAFRKVTANTQHKLHGMMRAHQHQMIYFSLVSRTIMVSSLVFAVLAVVTFNANIAVVFLIVTYTANIVDQLFTFSNGSLRNYNRSIGDAGDMVGILQQPAEVQDPAHPETKQMTRGAIHFKRVAFTHSGAEQPLFNGLDLRVKPGEKVGLVGPSGSGKTTLTRLLLRFSDVNSGSVNIDGQNIASVRQADLRDTISYVPQEPILFHRTIAENIAYARPDASLQEIEAIAKQANAHEFVKDLPLRYDTLVGERGVKLSGGQRQRIAIARAMLKNAPILVLDEATSALDSESEELIQEALWKLMEGRTAIVIAHRLSTIQKMDRILVLDQGTVVEQGTHKELIQQKGTYAGLWHRQSGGFLEE